MVLGKKVAIFDWEWSRNSAPRDEQKRPCELINFADSLDQVQLQQNQAGLIWIQTV